MRPLICGGDQGLLHGVFGLREVAEAMEQDTEHLRREVAQEMLGMRMSNGCDATAADLFDRARGRRP